jgi:hypothetical protein
MRCGMTRPPDITANTVGGPPQDDPLTGTAAGHVKTMTTRAGPVLTRKIGEPYQRPPDPGGKTT